MLTMLAFVALGQTSSSPLIAQMKVPFDPANGYFDYVLAGEELTKGHFDMFQVALQNQTLREIVTQSKLPPTGTGEEKGAPPRWEGESLKVAESLVGLNRMDVRQRASDRFRKALAYLENARNKPLFDPRKGMPFNPEETPPELAVMKTTAKFCTMMADWNYAQGRPLAAGQNTMDVFRMSQMLKTSPLMINALVSRAITALGLASVERHLPHMSYPEAVNLGNYAKEQIGKPSPFVAALGTEKSTTLQQLGDLRNGKATAGNAVQEAVLALSPGERKTVIDTAQERAVRNYDQVIAVLAKDELEWVGFLNKMSKPGSEDQPSDVPLDQQLAESGLPTNSVLEVAVMERVQLRLLRAAMAIVQYRWVNDLFPDALKDVGSDELFVDCVLKVPMKYRNLGTEFELSATGPPRLGELRLRFRRAAGFDGPPPPP
jgi:hypothetical protein